MEEREKIVDAFSKLSPQYEKVINQELKTFWGWSYEEFVSELLSDVDDQVEGLILDLATGTGAISLSLYKRRKIKPRIVGLDITFSMLRVAQKKINVLEANSNINLVCGSAQIMPYRNETFSVVLCGLATHHMEIDVLISEIARVIKPRGKLTITDVGASNLWKLPFVKTFLRVVAFIYFLLKNGLSRAWIESLAVSNVHTAQEWHAILAANNFTDINIDKLSTSRVWSPSPLAIRATFHNNKENNGNSK